MPSNTEQRIAPTPQTQVDSYTQPLQVAASPVNTYISPQQNPELNGLVSGLAAIHPALNQFLDHRAAEHAQAEGERGRAAAAQGQFATYQEGFGALNSQASPWFQRAYMEQVGRNSADSYKNELAAHLQTNMDPNNPDPNQAQKLIKTFYQDQTKGIQDPHYLAGFTPASEQANMQALDNVSQAHLARVRENAEDNIRKQVGNSLADPQRDPLWLEKTKLQARATNLPVKDVEENAFEQTAMLAITKGDPGLLKPFEMRTSDGQSAYSEREATKYRRALMMAQHQADLMRGDNSEIVKLNAQMRIDAHIEAAKQYAKPIDFDYVKKEIGDMVEGGYWNGAHGAEMYKQAAQADVGYQKAIANANFYRQGYAHAGGITADGHMGPLSKEEFDRAARTASSQIAAQVNGDKTIPDAQKESTIFNKVVQTAIQNRTVDPDHLAFMKVGATAVPTTGAKGDEQMPPAFQQGQQLAYAYWKQDPVNFRRSFGDDKQSVDLYERYFTALDRDPNKDPKAAFRTALLELRGGAGAGQKPVDVDPKTVAKVVTDAVGQLNDNGGALARWWKARGIFSTDMVPGRQSSATDVYAQDWIKKSIEEKYHLNPSIDAKAAAELSAKDFNAQHVIVNGAWVNVSGQNAGMKQDDADDTTRALEQYKMIAYRDSGMHEYFGHDDAARAHITLSPNPESVTPERGAEYRVFINNRPTSKLVNLDSLRAQYHHLDVANAVQRATETRDMMATIDAAGANPETFSEPAYRKLQSQLADSKQVGFISKDMAGEYRDKLDKAYTDWRTKTEFTDKQNVQNAARAADPNAAPLTTGLAPFSGSDLADLKDTGKFTVDPAATFGFVRNANAKGEVGAALAGMVGGYGQTRYIMGSQAKVGFGYDLLQDDDHIINDLVRSRIAVDRLQAPRVLKGLRSGEWKVNEYEARQLYNAQASRVSGDIKKEIGEKSWGLLPVTSQHALTVAYLNTAPANHHASFEAAKVGDWATVGQLLNVDESHKKSAVAAIRCLLSGQQTFSATLANHF